MKQIINLALRTEFSFQKCFGRVASVAESQTDYVGIADANSTFGHVPLSKACKEQDKQAIYGVRLMVVQDPAKRITPRGQFGPEYIFIAKNYEGLKEIYRLVGRAYENFYYRPTIGLVDVWKLSENVIVIAEEFKIAERIDYLALTQTTRKAMLKFDIPRVAITNNDFIMPDDRPVYELHCGPRNTEKHSYQQHILSTDEWFRLWGDEEAINNTHKIAEQCKVEMPYATNVKYTGEFTIEQLCIEGAKHRGIDLDEPEYAKRYKREMDLIKEKDFTDYFMVVGEMLIKAKKEMLVGPSRGSSAGSLVCYLLLITEIDPIKWDLLFERFIDINRFDMPDIDIDFPDTKRHNVIKELIRTNGEDHVRMIATITQMKVRSALGDFAQGLGIPPYEVEAVKDAAVKVSSGDARFGEGISETFKTGPGKEFIEKYPQMQLAVRIENHARHTGVHAAGVIVANEPLSDFASVNVRDNTIMIDKRSAVALNLLKIDCLGLTTLTILEECAELAGFDYNDFYTIKYDDDEVFKLFRDGNLRGVFQFEGYALANLCRTIKVRHIEDIVAITALARPGPLHGGGAALFGEVHSGKKEVEYMSSHETIIKHTKNTSGTIIYQEQLMNIAREFGGMSWEDVSKLRKVVSKRQGKEYFDSFRATFLEGTRAKNVPDHEAIHVWESMLTFGAYGFNRSHAVAYGMISYWTAWAKKYHPLEFSVAILNNTKDDANAIKFLREIHKTDDIKYTAIDPEVSIEKWSVYDGKLLGGLTAIDGIGPANAKKIIKCRKEGTLPPVNLIKKLANPKTNFDILFPAHHYWKELYDSPSYFGLKDTPIDIVSIGGKGTYTFIGKLVSKNVRDLNEYQNVVKRGGEIFEEDIFLLNITVEDDTDSIMCRIDRKKYEAIGKEIAETGKDNIDWYLIQGNIISDDIRFVFINTILKLGDGINETVDDIF